MTIAQVAKVYGLSADTLRYYEKIGLLPDIRRTAGGIRDYTEEDCRWVNYIKCMRAAGISVDTLITYVALFRQGNATIQERKKLLLKQREQIVKRIEELNEALSKLDWKLDGYEERMLQYEDKLTVHDPKEKR